MHRLLERQLKRHFGKDAKIPEDLQTFIDTVNDAYNQSDADRALLERSLDLTSEELSEQNLQLNKLFEDEQLKNQIIATQSKALLEVVQSVALGQLDVDVAVPEGIEVLSELAVGIEFMIDDIQEMLEEQERAREIIETALTQTEALYIGSDRVLRAQSAGELLLALIRSTALQKYNQAAIYLFDSPLSPGETPTAITVSASWEQTREISGETVGMRQNFEQYPANLYIDRFRPVLILDVNNDDRLDEETRATLAMDSGIQNIGFWPLAVSGQWLGFIVGQGEQVFELDENELRQIDSLTDQTAIVINGIRLYEQAQSALAEAEATHRLYLRKKWDEYTTQKETQITFIPDVFTSVSRSLDEEPGLQKTKDFASQLDIPITIRGQSIGRLGLEIPQGSTELSPEQQNLVNTITHQMGLALENLRLIDETQKSASREQVIREITGQIRETLDMETVLRTATTEIRKSLGLTALNIQLGTPPTEDAE